MAGGISYPGGSTYSGPGAFTGSIGGSKYEQNMYNQSMKDFLTPGSMGYGNLPRAPGEEWNAWMDRQSALNKTYSGPGLSTGSAALRQMQNPSGISGGSISRSGGGVSYGGPIMQQQAQPVEFYLGPAPKLSELNLNFEELGKRAMEANKPYAEQYTQFAPGTEAGTRALSNLGATMATGQLSRDMAGQIGRGAAQLGLSTGVGGRSGIGRNILARDLGLSSLQVQQQGMDFLNRSSQLAQQAQQAMSPIAPTEVFGTAANQASINQQIQNQNLLNAWLSQGLPGQFDITKGQYIGYQPGSYATTRPTAPGINYRYG